MLVILLAAFLIIPGTILGYLAQLRPIPALALGGAVTAGILSILMQLFAWIAIPWRLGPVILCEILILAAIAGLTRLNRLNGHKTVNSTRQLPGLLTLPPALFVTLFTICLIAAAALQTIPFRSQLNDYSLPAQLFDSMFHYSGTQLEAQSGNAAWRGSLNGLYANHHHDVYYPNQWHSIAALFVPWAKVTLITNSLLFALSITVWPLGTAALADYAFGRRSLAIPLAVLLSPAPLVFPYYLGVLQSLYPYVLAIMWWQPLIWVLLKSFDTITHKKTRQKFSPLRLAIGGLVFLAALHAHPSIIGFAAAFVFITALSLVITGKLQKRWWIGVGVLAISGLIAAPWLLRRLGMARKSGLADDDTPLTRAVGAALHLSQLYAEPWWAILPLALIMITGLGIYSFTRRDFRFLLWWVGIAVLAAATKTQIISLTVLTALWYGAFDRIAAGSAFILPVFAAGGLAYLSHYSSKAAQKLSRKTHHKKHANPTLKTSKPKTTPITQLITIAAGLAVIALSFGSHMWTDRKNLVLISYMPGYQFHAPWVTLAEFQAQNTLKLPAHAKVIGDPSSGAGLLLATSNTAVVYPSLSDTVMSPDQLYLAKNFNQIHTDPQICRLLRQEKTQYFYADATGAAPNDFQFSGFANVDVSSGFTAIHTLDQAVIYRIDLCG